MNELNGFWIFDKEGNILFQLELFAQGTEDFNSALFSSFILAVQSFIKNLGEDQIQNLELGKSKVFITRDKETDLILTIKADKEAKEKKFTKFLEKVQEKVRNIYYEKLFSSRELKEYIKTSFYQDFDELVKDNFKQRLNVFFNTL